MSDMVVLFPGASSLEALCPPRGDIAHINKIPEPMIDNLSPNKKDSLHGGSKALAPKYLLQRCQPNSIWPLKTPSGKCLVEAAGNSSEQDWVYCRAQASQFDDPFPKVR
jgi:hypothetical protein